MRTFALLLVLSILLLPVLGHARVEERRALQEIHELPAAVAAWPQEAPLLSSLEWSAIAPPGAGLYPIEDEPYIQLQGSYHKGLAYPGHALTSISLISHIVSGGSYEAVVSLRGNPQKGDANPLRYSFDLSAASMVRRAQLFPEQRLAGNYVLTELRSPLGLTDPRDKENCGREYLGYQAELINPLTNQLPPGSAQYTILNGELRLVRVVDGVHYLLTVEFRADDYPWALNLTRNIAGFVLEQFAMCDRGACLPEPLSYGAEWYWPTADAVQLGLLDARSADLLEQPDSGIPPARFPDGIPAGMIVPRQQELPVWPDQPPAEPGLPHISIQQQPANAAETAPAAAEEPVEFNEAFEAWLAGRDRQPKPAETPPAADDNAVSVTIDEPAIEVEPAIPQQREALLDASAKAPPLQDASSPIEVQLPRLFEGWGSPRSTATPASRGLLGPFAGWLRDPPEEIVARIAEQIKRRQLRGR